MLGAVETLVAERLRDALPEGTSLVSGPGIEPQSLPQVRILARSLTRPAPPTPEAPASPAQAHLAWRWQLAPEHPAPDGDGRDFVLPDDPGTTLEEVQSPPGRLAARIDDYVVEDGRLRFRVAPTEPVEIVTRGGPAQGWTDRRPASIRVEIEARASDPAEADALLSLALAHALGAFAGLDLLTLAWNVTPGLRLRLFGPQAELRFVRRSVLRGGDAPAACSCASLVVAGSLETTVTTGEVEPRGVIASVEPTIRVEPGRPPP